MRDGPHSRMGRLNTVKVSVLPKLINRFNIISIKAPTSYFVDTDKLILKFIQRGKRPIIANITPKKKNTVLLADFKIYYKAKVIKTVWYWHRIDKQINGT